MHQQQQQQQCSHSRTRSVLEASHMRHVVARCSAFRGVVCSSPAPLLLQGSCSCASRSRQHGAPGVEFATAAAAASKLTTRQQALQPHTVAAAAVASKAAAVADRTPAAGAGKSLMIVESPTKATKIQKFLGDEYQVLASYGHVRDLLNKPGAVDPHEDFKLVWAVSGAAGEARLKEIAAAASGSRAVLLATDPDREGEAISWHITQELQRRGVLRPGQVLQRVTFNEVTQKAVKEALQHPRQVSDDLVNAYLARRALDFLLGFNLSPLLWRRLGPAARSAGRVQSVALRLVCEREDSVQLFRPDEYWSIEAAFNLNSNNSSSSGGGGSTAAASLPARLVEVDGQKLSQMAIHTQQQAYELVHRLWQLQPQPQLSSSSSPSQQQEQQQVLLKLPQPSQDPVWYTVRSVVKRPVRRNPPPPLVTSTLQQEAARRLGFGASKTMQVAQQLYEGANTGEGLITYMRTDGVSLSAEAVDSLRATISSRYGDDHLPAGGPRVYKSRAKNAQEAHEAIRPSNPALTPDQVRGLTPDQANLYSLVWRRAMASQMESAELQQVSVEFVSPCGTLLLRCSGSTLVAPGWLAAWSDWHKVGAGAAAGVDDDASDGGDSEGVTGASTDDEDDDLTAVVAGNGGKAGSSISKAALSQLLQQLQEGQRVLLDGVVPNQHFTKPPPRYSEASMVKTLEEAGVGRPSTYAPIIRKLLERGYVVKSGRTLVPSPLGRLLTAYLTIHFTEYVDVNFTAKVEEQLDEVSAGDLAWKQLMQEFWVPLEHAMTAAKGVSTTEVFQQLEQRLGDLIFAQPQLPPPSSAAEGDNPTAPGDADAAADAAQSAVAGLHARASDPRRCPLCGGQLVLKPSRAVGGFIGCSNYESQGCRFGRPLWPDLEEALSLSDEEEARAAAAAGGGSGSGSGDELGTGAMLGAAKLLGRQPGSALPVYIKRGPFGLYVQLGEEAPLFSPGGADSSSSSKKSSSSGGPVTRASLPRSLNWSNTTLEHALQLLALPRMVGTHPEDGEPIYSNSGRFGPYVVHRTLYAPLPKDRTPQDVSLEEAVESLTAKAARMRARGKDPYAEKPSKKKTKSSSGKKRSSASSSSKKGDDSSSKPKAPRLNGYQLFGQEVRSGAVVAPDSNSSSSSSSSNGNDVGSSSSKATLSQIAAWWKALPEDTKADYADRARRMNEEAAAAGGGGGGDSGAGGGVAGGAAMAQRVSSSAASSSSKSRGRSLGGTQASTGLDSSSSVGSSRRRMSTRAAAAAAGGGDAAAGGGDDDGEKKQMSSRRRSISTTSSSTRSQPRGTGSSSSGSSSRSRSTDTGTSSSSSRSRQRPARPQSGYQLFVQEYRASGLGADVPSHLKPSEVLKQAAAAWGELGEAEKAVYNNRASGGGGGSGVQEQEQQQQVLSSAGSQRRTPSNTGGGVSAAVLGSAAPTSRSDAAAAGGGGDGSSSSGGVAVLSSV